ncbi:hypothetical protein [Dongia deserti]|uniref:hypothetical protein n=1 Tax=Dongia deserti TaxID=2268030 RepID=UPI000E65190C|nr:hypothetical protein [Dongia deserti]
MGQDGWCTAARWLRAIAAGAIALTLGLGQAHAVIESAHDGGQGQDKARAGVAADLRSIDGFGARGFAATNAAAAEPRVAEGAAAARSLGTKPAALGVATDLAPVAEASADADVAVEGDAADSRLWSRTVTRTVTTPSGVIRSVTRSYSFAADGEGNMAVAKAVARVRVPDDVEAVEKGAGRITTKTSVDVTGEGAASADAGGSIAVTDGEVEVSTWGETSAEVF